MALLLLLSPCGLHTAMGWETLEPSVVFLIQAVDNVVLVLEPKTAS